MYNKIKIHINGMRYSIKSAEDPAYVMQLAEEIDEMVTSIMQQASVSMNEALVLCALSCLDASKKAENGADNLRSQVTSYAEEAAKARLEVQEVRRELERRGGKNGMKK